jgi:hypothetical protein
MLGISTDEKTVENRYQVMEFVLESRRTTIHETAGNFILVSSQHSERQCEHMSDCHQLCALTPGCEAGESYRHMPGLLREALKETQN